MKAKDDNGNENTRIAFSQQQQQQQQQVVVVRSFEKR